MSKNQKIFVIVYKDNEELGRNSETGVEIVGTFLKRVDALNYISKILDPLGWNNRKYSIHESVIMIDENYGALAKKIKI